MIFYWSILYWHWCYCDFDTDHDIADVYIVDSDSDNDTGTSVDLYYDPVSIRFFFHFEDWFDSSLMWWYYFYFNDKSIDLLFPRFHPTILFADSFDSSFMLFDATWHRFGRARLLHWLYKNLSCFSFGNGGVYFPLITPVIRLGRARLLALWYNSYCHICDTIVDITDSVFEMIMYRLHSQHISVLSLDDLYFYRSFVGHDVTIILHPVLVPPLVYHDNFRFQFES